jgi:hypothetical protein
MLQPLSFQLTKAWPHHSKVLAISVSLCGLWSNLRPQFVLQIPLTWKETHIVSLASFFGDVVTGFFCLSNAVSGPDAGGFEGLVDGIVRVGSDRGSRLVVVGAAAPTG